MSNPISNNTPPLIRFHVALGMVSNFMHSTPIAVAICVSVKRTISSSPLSLAGTASPPKAPCMLIWLSITFFMKPFKAVEHE